MKSRGFEETSYREKTGLSVIENASISLFASIGFTLITFYILLGAGVLAKKDRQVIPDATKPVVLDFNVPGGDSAKYLAVDVSGQLDGEGTLAVLPLDSDQPFLKTTLGPGKVSLHFRNDWNRGACKLHFDPIGIHHGQLKLSMTFETGKYFLVGGLFILATCFVTFLLVLTRLLSRK